MAALRESKCALTPAQLLRCREYLGTWPTLGPKDRTAFIDTVTRDVWLMVNPEYNWTEHGLPEDDGVTTYYWTKNVCDGMLLYEQQGQ